MSRLRKHCAQGIADAIAKRVQLTAPPAVVAAPPSNAPDYPSVAVWVEHAAPHYTSDDDLLVDGDGNLIAGALATDDAGEFVTGVVATLAPGVTASHIGTLRCEGRVWVGARLEPKREEVEEEVRLAFEQEREAPGRLQIPLAGARVGQFTISFGIGTALIDESEWSSELAFSERLWAWIKFALDVPMYVPRYEPLNDQLILAITADLDTVVASKTDLHKLPDLQQFTVDTDGNVTPTTQI